MLIFCYLIYKDTIKEEEYFSKKMKWILGILFFVLVVINPMIIGYYHTLLTEFVAITFAIIGCYLSWKWMDVNFKENKIKYSIYTIVLAILTAIAWQLKQPYVGTILFPVIISAIISFIRNTNLKNFIQRFITILICGIALIIGIKTWNAVLKKCNVEIKEERTSGGYLASGIVNGINNYDVKDKEDFDTIEKIENCDRISQEDKDEMKLILEDKSNYKSFKVIDINKDNYKIIYTKGKVISTGESIKFWFNTLVHDPIAIAGSYATNYLATISIYDIDFEGSKIIVDKHLNFSHTKEIDVIGLKIYTYGNETVFPLPDKYETYASEYRTVNKPVVAINWVMRKLQLPVTLAMKIAFLLLPILAIISIVAVFRTKKKYTEKYTKIIDMITILYVFSILHILVHALLGSIIDRYTMPALATTFIGIIMSIYAIVYRKKYKI